MANKTSLNCADCRCWSCALYRRAPALSGAALDGLAREQKVVGARQTLYRMGAKTGVLYSLVDGWAYRYGLLPDGRRQILSMLYPGDLVSTLLLVGDELAFSVQALTEVRVCVLDRDVAMQVVREQPAMQEFLLRLFAYERLVMDRQAVNIGRRSAEERIGHFILGAYFALRSRGLAHDLTFPFPLRQHHLADALGLTQVHVGRVLKSLVGDGLIRLSRRVMTILDLDRLSERSATEHSEIGRLEMCVERAL